MTSLIQVENLNISFGKKHLLKDISFEIKAGELIRLSGPNGCGKTTLLESLIGISSRANIKRNFSSEDYAYLPQMSKVYPKLSLFLKDVCNQPNALYSQELTQRHWSVASGGEKMKALVSKTLAASDKIIFLDEPFNHLDKESVKILIKLLQEKVNQGCTVLYIGHNEIDFNQRVIEVNQWSC